MREKDNLPTLANDQFEIQRKEMIDKQLIQRGIRGARILNAMGSIPRENFLPTTLNPENETVLPVTMSPYLDCPQDIGEGQTISQPYITAFMLQALECEPHHKVLEIGTGSGYQTAILSALAAKVYSIEIREKLLTRAQKVLKKLGINNVECILGDGWKGLPASAPFDRIIVSAAAEEIPQKLINQLKDGGRMILPIGASFQTQRLVQIDLHGGHRNQQELTTVRFVPFVKSTDD